MKTNFEIATFAMGCFWCYEGIFKMLKGVIDVKSGYIGGIIENPTYEMICTGKTNHAEAVQIKFDPNTITYQKLLEIFFDVHDPTTLNRQGNDVGTQYRSEIFFHNKEQMDISKKYITKLESDHRYNDPIVTKVSEFTKFYEAEDYHQDFYNKNPNYGYCSVIISPKIKKFKEKYSNLLK